MSEKEIYRQRLEESFKAYLSAVNAEAVERVLDMADALVVPAEFWAGLSDADIRRIVCTGEMGADDCARLWGHLEREDEPPTVIHIGFRVRDLMRSFPQKRVGVDAEADGLPFAAE